MRALREAIQTTCGTLLSGAEAGRFQDFSIRKRVDAGRGRSAANFQLYLWYSRHRTEAVFRPRLKLELLSGSWTET